MTDLEFLRDVRVYVSTTALQKAPSELFGELCELYSAARMADDPFVLDDYPDEERILEYLERGELYVLRRTEDGFVVGACVLTHDPIFASDEEVLFRGKACRCRLPGENWFHPGQHYMALKYQMVRPPLDPLFDVGTLIEHAVRMAAADGIYELRARVNLQDRAHCRLFVCAGFTAACTVRRPSNEAYVGFYLRRAPKGYIFEDGGFRSPTFEKLTDAEYAEMLAKMGIEKEIDWDHPYYRPEEDDEEIIIPPFGINQ